VLDQTLSPISEARTLVDGAPPATSPGLVAVEDGWVLSWASGSRPSFYASFAHLGPEGAPLEPRRIVFRGINSSYGGPAPLALDDDLYLGVSQREEDFYEQSHLHRFTCVEGPSDLCAPQEARSGDCLGDVLYGWRWDGGECAPVIGCLGDCMGADCERLSPTGFACLADHEPCPSIGPRCEGRLEPLASYQVCGPTELGANTDERLELSSEMSACDACGLSASCEVEVAGPFTLRLLPGACRAPIDCDCDPEARETVTATCYIPPLSPGAWTVETEDGASFTIEVRPVWEEPSTSPLCR
jgi:hypothetical protein